MNLFTPIQPLFKTPFPQKTAPCMLDLTPTPETVFDKLSSPVKTPPETPPPPIKSDLIAKLLLQQLAHTPAEKQLIHKFP